MNRSFIVTLLIIVFIALVSRAYLFTVKGVNFYSDEYRYVILESDANKAITTRNLEVYVKGIFMISARPFFGIIYLPAIFIDTFGSNSLVGLYENVLFNIGIIIIIFLIAKEISNNLLVAFITSFIFIFSVASFIYFRHLLPFDASHLLLGISAYLFLRRANFLVVGVLLALSFLTHPGVFYYILPAFILLLFLSKKNKARKSFEAILNLNGEFKGIKVSRIFYLNPVIALTIGFVSCIGIFELIGRIIAHMSYLESAGALSDIITQGDFVPLWKFLNQYANTLDGNFGSLIVYSGLISWIILLRSSNVKTKILGMLVPLQFLILELYSDVLKKTAMLGRTIRPFYFLLIISFVLAFYEITKKIKRKSLRRFISISFFLILMLSSLINGVNNMELLKRVQYPLEFNEKARKVIENQNAESLPIANVQPGGFPDHFNPKKKQYLIVNAALLYPYSHSESLPCAKKNIILDERYVLSQFPPYVFEGYSEKMRKLILETDPPTYKLVLCN